MKPAAISAVAAAAASCSLLLLSGNYQKVQSFTTIQSRILSPTRGRRSLMRMADIPPDKPAGSFFHQVPDDSSDSNDNNHNNESQSNNNNKADDSTNDNIVDQNVLGDAASASPDFNDAVLNLIRTRRKPPRASQPSTINGVPTEKVTGFGKSNGKSTKRRYSHMLLFGPQDSSLEPPINDPSNPQLDDQGYTLYTDETWYQFTCL